MFCPHCLLFLGVLQVHPHNSFKESIEESRREQTSLSHPNCGLEPFSNFPVEVNGTAGLVAEVSHDADGVSIDIVVVHCRPECSMPHSVKFLLEVKKYIIEILLMLEISLAQNPDVEYLFSCAASCPEFCLLFSYNFLCRGS